MQKTRGLLSQKSTKSLFLSSLFVCLMLPLASCGPSYDPSASSGVSTSYQSVDYSEPIEDCEVPPVEDFVLEYSKSQNGFMVSGYSGYLNKIRLPDEATIEGVTAPIVGISKNAFRGCTFKTVIIPDSVTSIGDDAFRDCFYLASVAIGNGVTSIGSRAFNQCLPLAKIMIPKSVISIGSYAFFHCDKLAYAIIPDSVISIGESAFGDNHCIIYCAAESKPSGWSDSWMYDAPEAIWGYERMILQDSVLYSLSHQGGERIARAVECKGNPSELVISDEIDGVPVVSIGALFARHCKSLTSVTIGKHVKFIEGSAFYECTSLASVVLPDSLTIIEKGAFYHCSSLTSVSFSSSLLSIGFWAFWGCSSLTSVSFSSSPTSIGDGAFSYCSSLTSIEIPVSITSIGSDIFFNSNLVEVTFPGTKEQWLLIKNGRSLIGKTPIHCLDGDL